MKRHAPSQGVKGWIWGCLGCCLATAGWAGDAPSTATKLADFSAGATWTVTAAPEVSVDFAADGLAHLRWQPAGEGAARKLGLQLKEPVALPANALRAGIWIFVEKPLGAKRVQLRVQDAAGRAFAYNLPVPPGWVKGWQYLDTYAFLANERGKLHPEVGLAEDRGTQLPQVPFSLLGLNVEAGAQDKGDWALGQIEADVYDLGCGAYHWYVRRPGEQYWMDTPLLRSGEEPWLPLSFLLPGGGEGHFEWYLQRGFQGSILSRGAQDLKFAAGDALAQREPLALGPLPAGDYKLQVTRRPTDLEQARPNEWKPVIWRAEGQTAWRGKDAPEGVRCLWARKTGGEGFAGWRQTVRIAEPGAYRLTLLARGDGAPEVGIGPQDKDWHGLPGGVKLRIEPGAEWSRREFEFKLPPETKYIYVDLLTSGVGTAEFDRISLQRADKELLANGSVEDGVVCEQTELELLVLSSPVSTPLPAGPALSVNPGEALEVPLPKWTGTEGTAQWWIEAAAGQKLASGPVEGETVKWTPPAPGTYHFRAERRWGKLLLDREERLLGCRTPADQIGPETFALTGKTLTENDLFGPGHNYFTWSDYEYHPDRPDFFKNCRQWIADGRRAGFDLIRLRIDWDFAEPLPGVYDFSVTDQLVAEVERQGGRVILEPRFGPPAWLEMVNLRSSHGRADFQRHGRVSSATGSVWSPGLLDAITAFTQAVVKRYRNDPQVAGYHLWGKPGAVDWTTLDRPWVGLLADYSPAALAEFYRWSGGKYSAPPQVSDDCRRPDLSPAWRDWTAFRRHGLETFFIDHVLKPLRELDPQRSVVGYFGLDFASERLTRSSTELGWRRHTGGSELYYQIPMQAVRAVLETGKAWPHEVHLMTPTPGGLEHATFQISSPGGMGYHWNCYWRSNIPVGTWTADREDGLKEWQSKWRPLWEELRDAELNQPIDLALVATWSTMHYMVHTFFPLRLGDYLTRPAAALYRDQLWPGCISENDDFANLAAMKLIVLPQGAAQVMPAKLADALEAYVSQGGKVAMFPDSGGWVVEEPDNPDALLKRLGWRNRALNAELQAVDAGNSGFAPSAKDDEIRPATVAAGAILPAGQPLFLQRTVSLPGENGTVAASFADGTPAVLSWPHGKGAVVLFGGTPDWEKCPGLMRALYAWAGGRRDIGSDVPFVQVNHLRAGQTHYAIVYRLLDTFRPHPPNHPTLGDRAELRKTPPVKATLRLTGLAAGEWELTELTADAPRPQKISAAQAAEGLPVEMYLAQTRVFKFTPVK